MPSRSLLRERSMGEGARVGFAELFFDLVFVFAVTQLSHFLLRHFTLLGAIETGLLMTAVWWVWIYTSWVTNWLDPAKTAVRLMLFVLMDAGLVLSTSIPEAFEGRGLAFALAGRVMPRTAHRSAMPPPASSGQPLATWPWLTQGCALLVSVGLLLPALLLSRCRYGRR